MNKTVGDWLRTYGWLASACFAGSLITQTFHYPRLSIGLLLLGFMVVAIGVFSLAVPVLWIFFRWSRKVADVVTSFTRTGGSEQLEFADSIEEIRARHRVRELDAIEDSMKLRQSPRGIGVRGFTGTYEIDTDLGPQSREDIFITRNPDGDVRVEVHRLPEGYSAIVGFVGPQDAGRLNEAGRHAPAAVVFLPEHDTDCKQVVSIPLKRILHAPQRQLGFGTGKSRTVLDMTLDIR